MSAPFEPLREPMEAGPAFDAWIAAMLGEDMPPSREYAMAKVAWRYIAVTGNPFTLKGGRLVNVPAGVTLRQPAGSTDWNDRYAFHIATVLGDEIAAEVDAYRMPPKPYSTDVAAADAMERKLVEDGHGEAYAGALMLELASIILLRDARKSALALIRATPLQRATAALAATAAR